MMRMREEVARVEALAGRSKKLRPANNVANQKLAVAEFVQVVVPAAHTL